MSTQQDVVAAYLKLADGLLRNAPGPLLASEQLPVRTVLERSNVHLCSTVGHYEARTTAQMSCTGLGETHHNPR